MTNDLTTCKAPYWRLHIFFKKFGAKDKIQKKKMKRKASENKKVEPPLKKVKVEKEIISLEKYVEDLNKKRDEHVSTIIDEIMKNFKDNYEASIRRLKKNITLFYTFNGGDDSKRVVYMSYSTRCLIVKELKKRKLFKNLELEWICVKNNGDKEVDLGFDEETREVKLVAYFGKYFDDEHII